MTVPLPAAALPPGATPDLDELRLRVLGNVMQLGLSGELPPEAMSLGLGLAECRALLQAVGLGLPEVSPAPAPGLRSPFLSPLIALLWAHRADDAPWTRLMAGTLASAAFGARHLWQDLGASGRAEVSALLMQHFPTLAAANVHQLKWKHHFFQTLGAELGMPDLRPPRCDGCEEQAVCFPAAVMGGPGEVLRVVALRR
jgi:nitrogen fixation protein NifQ